MCANPQSNWLNTIAVRASYVCLLEFWVDPLNWQSFIEIGGTACGTTARCSRGHALKKRFNGVCRLSFVLCAFFCQLSQVLINCLISGVINGFGRDLILMRLIGACSLSVSRINSLNTSTWPSISSKILTRWKGSHIKSLRNNSGL